MFNTGKKNISKILRGERWPEVGGPLSINDTKNAVANRRKITDEQVVELRILGSKKVKVKELAAKFKVDRHSISKILDGISYPKLVGPIRYVDYPGRKKRV